MPFTMLLRDEEYFEYVNFIILIRFVSLRMRQVCFKVQELV